jgi:hypothetical protein
VSEELAYFGVEVIEELPEVYRYCDNSLIFWLLSLLVKIMDEATVNMFTALQRWSSNCQLWRARNYKGAYQALLRHIDWYQAEINYDELRWKIKDLEIELDALKAQGKLNTNLRHVWDDQQATGHPRSRSAKGKARINTDNNEQLAYQAEFSAKLYNKTATASTSSSQRRFRTSSSYRNPMLLDRRADRPRERQSRRDRHEAQSSAENPDAMDEEHHW